MNSPQFVFTTARCVSSGFELGRRCLARLRLAGLRRLDRGAAGHALARRFVVPAAATAGEERNREQRCEPQVQPASERQIEVTSATYVSVSLLGAPLAFAHRGRAGVVRGEREVARGKVVELETEVLRAGEDVLRGMLDSSSSSTAVVGITWSRPRAPALDVAPCWNSDSTRATAVSSERGRRVSRAASTNALRNREGIGHRGPVAAVTGIAGMCATGADGLPRPRVGDRHRTQAAGERDDEKGSQRPRHEAGC